MKKILLALLLLSTPTWADNPFTATETSPPVTMNAVCASPTTGCAAGQFVSVKMGGRNTAVVTMTHNNLSATISAYVSADNGQNWVQTSLRSGIGALGILGSTNAFAASNATVQIAIFLPYGGVTDVMLIFSVYTSGSSTASIIASNSPSNLFPYLVFAKGAQTTAFGLATQDLKDSGRSFVVLTADGVTPAIAETVITFSQNKAGAVTAGQTTYAITSNKTLRLQSLICSMTAGAAANRVRIVLRLNTGGACVVGSGLVGGMELAPNYGTVTAAEGGAYGEWAIPDGLELSGSTWNVCLSENATAASGTLTCTLTGYEY